MYSTSSPVLLVAVLTSACLEVPILLDEFDPPPPDLGSGDTWAPLAGLEPGGGSPGLDAGEGPAGDDADPIDSPIDPALAQLRILEVLVDPPGKDGGPESPEFVEIGNPGPSPVDLSGLRLQATSWPILDGVELGLAGVVLPVEGVLVIRRYANDADPALAGVSVQGSLVFSSFLHGSGLRNGDGAVGLGPSSGFADVMVYGVSAEPPFDSGWLGEPASLPESGQSLCRSPIASDHDDASDWSACSPSPGASDPEEPGSFESETGASETGASETGADEGPQSIPEGAVQIVEVASNPPGPASTEKAWEYVEILNVSENEIELEFARIGDDVSPDAAGIDPLAFVSGDGGCVSSTCLAPGRRALIVAQGYLGETADALVLATDDSTIADGGLALTEPVVLWDGLDGQISSYRIWPDPSGDPLPTDELALHRVDPLALDEPANWESAPPTPGS